MKTTRLWTSLLQRLRPRRRPLPPEPRLAVPAPLRPACSRRRSGSGWAPRPSRRRLGPAAAAQSPLSFLATPKKQHVSRTLSRYRAVRFPADYWRGGVVVQPCPALPPSIPASPSPPLPDVLREGRLWRASSYEDGGWYRAPLAPAVGGRLPGPGAAAGVVSTSTTASLTRSRMEGGAVGTQSPPPPPRAPL